MRYYMLTLQTAVQAAQALLVQGTNAKAQTATAVLLACTDVEAKRYADAFLAAVYRDALANAKEWPTAQWDEEILTGMAEYLQRDMAKWEAAYNATDRTAGDPEDHNETFWQVARTGMVLHTYKTQGRDAALLKALAA